LKIKNILRLSLFLLLAYCNLSQALGMNEAIVTSNLGEPLSAQINITDVEKSPDISCFSVTDANSPPAFTKVSLTVKHQASGYQLIIKSRQSITEPIINLRVTHHCDPSINRDYVVLLDPPLQNEANANTASPEGVNDQARSQNKTASTENKPAEIVSKPASANYATKENISKKKKAHKTASASSLDKKLTAMYTGQPQTTAKPDSQYEATTKSRPYLSISGGHSQSGEDLTLPQLALKLETRLDLSREENTLPPSTSEVMDELTAMDNRLALLKTQIISLQDKNEKLKTDAANAEKKLADSIRTLRIAAGLMALLAFLASAAWLRRKLIDLRPVKTELNWFDSSDPAGAADKVAESATAPAGKLANDAKNANFNDAFYENSTYDISSGFSAQPANAALTTSINGNANEDILESVDVLLEYGRSGLAIHLLQDYLADHPSESPKVWLKLLSLTAEHGSEADYAQTVADCNHHYRINMPGFAEAKKAGTATIEDFPYITKDLETAWGSAAAVTLLDDLIYNSESQPEEGFEPEIFEQLFMLKQIAENLDASPASTVSEPEQTPINTSGSPRMPGHAENSTALPQAAAGFAAEPMMMVYETTADVPAANWYDAQPQTPSSADTFPTLDFDDEVTQQHPAQALADTLPGPDEANTVQETRLTLEAPEIDFSQHIKEVAEEQISTTAATGGKQQKRIVKDSNLIDWVLTDEN